MERDDIRQALEHEEQRLQAMAEGIRTDGELDLSEQDESGGELSNVDQHTADSATEETQRGVSFSMLEQVEAELSDVERALRKLGDGSYGTCEACSKPIDEQRLEAMPAARFCVEDQTLAEGETAGRGMSGVGIESPSSDATTPI